MKLMKSVVSVFVLAVMCYSQDFSKFSISGYVDTYYSYDNDKNGSSLRQFSSVAPYRDEFRINIAQVSLKYNDEKIRGAITVHYGDIPQANWPLGTYQFIQEAYACFSPKKRLWIDAGYFLTHIGAEGLYPKNNFLTSQALTTFYEPFFQSGIRIGYDFSDKFYGCLHLLNGYNVFADNNKNKSAGVTLDFKPDPKTEVIYNNIIGNEIPSPAAGKLRVYNNLVLKFFPAKKLDILIGGDYCLQENSKIGDSSACGNMFSALASIRFRFSNKFSASLRGEMHHDKDGIMSGVFIDSKKNAAGLKAFGITIGIEFRPVERAYIRIESRYLSANSEQEIFTDGTQPKNSRFEVITNAGIEF